MWRGADVGRCVVLSWDEGLSQAVSGWVVICESSDRWLWRAE